MRGTSRLEHCPNCDGVELKNYMRIMPGEDVEVFVECAACGSFVARYTLKMYTSEKPYESYLRLMLQRPMVTGSQTQQAQSEFAETLMAHYKAVKQGVEEQEDGRAIEEILANRRD